MLPNFGWEVYTHLCVQAFEVGFAIKLYINYNGFMPPKRGRPPTGHKPVVAVRMDPAALKRGLIHARARKKALGTWLEEAIEEKIEREHADERRE